MYREEEPQRERHLTIELSDVEHLEKIYPRVSKDLEEAGFTYRHPTEEDYNNPALKDKFDKVKMIVKDNFVVDFTEKLEKDIQENIGIIEIRKKNEKSKSKSTKRKPKKVHTKSNKAAMENIQEKL